jgi:hypothetical protein
MDDPVIALYKAIQSDNLSQVRQLLEEGVRLEGIYGMAYHPLAVAAEFGLADLVDRFHKEGGVAKDIYTEALHVAAEQGNREIVYQILGYGFDGTSTADFDLGMAAAIGGQLTLLKEFDQKGFRTNYKDEILMTAVIEHDHADVLDYLFQKGARVDTAAKLCSDLEDRYDMIFAACRRVIHTWKQEALAISLQPLHETQYEELRRKTAGEDGYYETGFVRLARAGRFDHAVALARQGHGKDQGQSKGQGGKMDVSDVLSRDHNGFNVVEILSEKKQVQQLFDVTLWKNGLDDLNAVYAAVPEPYRQQADFPAIAARYRADVLRAKSKRNPRLRP